MTELHVAARRYVGVPWVHRGRDPGGIDCAGLFVLAARDIGWEVQDAMYGIHPKRGLLEVMLHANCGDPARDMQPGDIVALRFSTKGPARHLGIVGDHPHGLSLIHTDSLIRRVVEQRLDEQLLSRIASVYRRAV